MYDPEPLIYKTCSSSGNRIRSRLGDVRSGEIVQVP